MPRLGTAHVSCAIKNSVPTRFFRLCSAFQEQIQRNPPAEPFLRCYASLSNRRQRGQELEEEAAPARELLFKRTTEGSRTIKWKPRWTTRDLEEQMMEDAQNRPNTKDVREMLDISTNDRGMKPTIGYYLAIMLANCDPETGSASPVLPIIDEARAEGLVVEGTPASEQTLTAALKVLAVHPDNHARNLILDQFRQEWLGPSVDALHFVVVGLVREGQLELALVKIEELLREKAAKDWLHTLMVQILCDAKDFAALLSYIYMLEDHCIQLSTATWLSILDCASQNVNHSATALAWKMAVEPEYLNPSLGLCRNVLLTASRSGDFFLAEDVLDHLERKPGRLSLSDMDLVVDAFTKGGGEDEISRIKLKLAKLSQESPQRDDG